MNYIPEPVKDAIEKFSSIPLIIEAPNKDVYKYLSYRGFVPKRVSSLFNWLRVVLPSSIIEDMIDILGISKYYVDYSIGILKTQEIKASNLAMLPISFTTTQLGFDDFHNGNATNGNKILGKANVGVVDTGANKVFNKPIRVDASNFFGIHDWNGHGTHVASTIGSPYNAPKYSDDIDMFGVAPASNLFVYNAMPLGISFSSDVIAGIERIYKLGAKIINLSLGSDIPDNYDYSKDAITQFIDKLCSNDKQLLFVGASGNSGANKLSTPAVSPNVIAVGSMSYLDGEVSWFSSYGSITINNAVRKVPDVVSFGGGRASKDEKYDEYILAFTGANSADLSDGLTPNNCGILHGTSQATPHVSGAFALLKDYFDNIMKKSINLNAQKVRSVLSEEYSYDEKKGYGLFDASVLEYLANRYIIEPIWPQPQPVE